METTTATQNPSRKRKHHPASKRGVCNSSSPFGGIVTRQKTQKYFFSHNRSGKSRKCRSIQVPSTRVLAKVVENVRGVENDDGEYGGSIKDLRLRRVFSKPIVKEDKSGKVELVDCKWVNGGNPNFVVLKKCDSQDDDAGDSNLNGANHESTMSSLKCDENGDNLSVNPKSTVLENCVDIRVDFVADRLNDENPKLPVLKKCDSVVTDQRSTESISEKGVNSNDGLVAGDSMMPEKCESVIDSVINDVLVALNEENVQTTPPDEHNDVLVSRDSVSRSVTKQISPGKEMTFKSSRRKVFKVPNSFTYKRLLPYCADIRVEDLNGENPNSLTDCGNPDLTVTEKRVDIRVDSVDTDKNSTLSVSEKGVDSSDNLVAADFMISENCERVVSSVINGVYEGEVGANLKENCNSAGDAGGKVLENRNLNLGDDFAEGRVGDTCEALNEENVQTTPPDEHNNVLMSRGFVSRSVTKQTSPSKEMTFSKSSRRKVFKVPNSYTYKRLLPYLMDIAKDEPCTPKATPSPLIKMEVEENDTENPKFPEGGIESKDHLSYDPKAISQLPDDSKQDLSQDQNVSPDNVAVSLDSPESSPNEANTGFKTEELAIVVSSGEPVADQTMGILKKNPRGCRGICSCLNCSSFRLNADKAFEFSKNQLLEAEEVAHDLMEELANLRCMLKESLTQATEVNQVEEALRRASYVENLARSRFTQMNEDLNVHCRTKALHRPRVNFRGDLQENVAGDPN